jgi:single-strand DNA-binding protein
MKKISIIGNLTRDCEIQKVNDSTAINFSVAVNEEYINKNGNQVKQVDYFDCTNWRKDKNNLKIANYLKSGTLVFVSGTPSTHQYSNNAGDHFCKIKIKVDSIELLNSKKSKEPKEAEEKTEPEAEPEAVEQDVELSNNSLKAEEL